MDSFGAGVFWMDTLYDMHDFLRGHLRLVLMMRNVKFINSYPYSTYEYHETPGLKNIKNNWKKGRESNSQPAESYGRTHNP